MTHYLYYQYRDASNFKQGGSIRLTAPLTDEQVEALTDTLDEGDYFIPQQVGVEPLQHLFGGIDPDDDHPWHELSDGYGTIEQGDFAMGEVSPGVFTPEELVAAFQRAAAEGWDALKYDPTTR